MEHIDTFDTLGKYYEMNNLNQAKLSFGPVREYELFKTMKDDLVSVLEYDFKVNKILYGIEIKILDLEKTSIFGDFRLLFSLGINREPVELDETEMMYLVHRCIGFIKRVENAGEYEIEDEYFVSHERALWRLKRLLDTATAHYLLEHGGAINLVHAYLLTGIGEQPIRNAASKGEINLKKYEHDPDETYLVDGDFTVANWVTTRKGYRNKPETLNTESGDVVRVPFASDGTYFSPSCKATKGYQIGYRYGSDTMKQRYIENYWEALSALEEMEKPHWRRPSSTSGKPGTVTGRSWGNIEKKVILEQLS